MGFYDWFLRLVQFIYLFQVLFEWTQSNQVKAELLYKPSVHDSRQFNHIFEILHIPSISINPYRTQRRG